MTALVDSRISVSAKSAGEFRCLCFAFLLELPFLESSSSRGISGSSDHEGLKQTRETLEATRQWLSRDGFSVTERRACE